jgi:hypothetical protein
MGWLSPSGESPMVGADVVVVVVVVVVVLLLFFCCCFLLRDVLVFVLTNPSTKFRLNTLSNFWR